MLYIKKILEFILLLIFFASIAFLITSPIDIYKTIEARNWEPVEVKVVSYKVMKYHRVGSFIRIKDLELGKFSNSVSVRYGGIGSTFIVFGHVIYSSDYLDQKKYPEGSVVKAFRNPNGSNYILEQNSINTLLVLFLLSCIYPLIAIWSIFFDKPKKISRQ